MNAFAQWYFLGAILFTAFVLYRSYKHNIEQDYLSVLAVFMLWPILLIAYWANLGRKNLYDEENEKIEGTDATDQA